ncbi:MAG: DUF1592 domain-containing protein, partial [Verrucomicrobiota bacterium]
WDNGPGPSDYWMRDICKKYHTDIEFHGKEGAHAWHIVGKDAVPGRTVSDVWQGPVMRIHSLQVEGPLRAMTYESKARQTYELDQHRQALKLFMTDAFRRPVTAEEIDRYLAVAKSSKEAEGVNHRKALISAFKAVLVSPDFLYLKESEPNLKAYQLANRMSYFLWSSMPDDALTQVQKELFTPQKRREQAERMLSDRKFKGLVEGLSESWLRLDKLGSMPPDNSKFMPYYIRDLGSLMRQETELFLSHMIRENRPVKEFLAANWSYLNYELASHYGIDGVEGSQMRWTRIPEDNPRRGLLGQGSILTLSANGVDTSPVVRGIWVLENILGTPPSPPPPDVEPLDVDTRGAKTIKQQLAKHRNNAACADCHAKIDPYGFPLEYYDAIGGFRETYFWTRWWSADRRQSMRMLDRPRIN